MSMLGLTPLGGHPVLGDGGGMFVVEDRTPPAYPFQSAQANHNGEQMPDSLSMMRPPSSVVLLRGNNDDATGRDGSEASEMSGKASWWQEPELDMQSLSCGQLLRLALDALLLVAVAVGVVLAAAFPADDATCRGGALPYVYAVFVALAGYEFAWLAYRVRLRLFLPFKLHEKQTSRDMYRQIIAYSVDLHTCAITPLAERFLRGRKGAAAALIALPPTVLAVGICFVPGATHMPVGYVALCVFLGSLSAALAPNVPTAVGVLIRFAYFFLSSLNVVLRNDVEAASGENSSSNDSRLAMDKYLAVVVESYSLLLLGVCLLLIMRVVTSKEPMESAVMVALDVAGLLYLSCAAAVLELFTQSAKVRVTGALAGFLAIVWSAELGAFFTERALKGLHFPWLHPLASRLSSRQNVEKLLGAVIFAVAAVFAASELVDFDMSAPFVALLAAGAVTCAHVGKLFLVSLKKVATISQTGSYLSVGGGALDRLDTLLFMAVVFAPFFQRAVYDQPQW
ncbi:hypothetical protein BBJ28_00023102 [Nothophytophthora sp. Chile5]|nr:hypothetical protein BBJ28_00023102 [Nothophytophthora sp. Chile5]